MVRRSTELKEILEILHKEETTILAGGTDVMVKKRNWAGLSPKISEHVLLAYQCEELQFIIKDKMSLRIGSMTRLEDLLKSDKIPKVFKAALREMASPAIRHVGTIGGNIGNASPAGDTLPILYAFDTRIELMSLDGKRSIPIQEFILGPGQTCKKSNEIIHSITLTNVPYNRYYYRKVGGRKSDAISKLSFVGMAQVEGGRIQDLRLAFGSVYKTVVRNKIYESVIAGELSDNLGVNENAFRDSIEKALALYDDLIQPISDQRSNARYRKKTAMHLLRDFLKSLEVII